MELDRRVLFTSIRPTIRARVTSYQFAKLSLIAAPSSARITGKVAEQSATSVSGIGDAAKYNERRSPVDQS